MRENGARHGRENNISVVRAVKLGVMARDYLSGVKLDTEVIPVLAAARANILARAARELMQPAT